MLPDYAELHCVSSFSFLRGASQPEELAEHAHALGYAALALTDECSLAGVVRAHVAAKTCGLKLIVGSELRLADGLRLALLACDREGYGNLSELITRGRRRATKGGYRLTRDDLADGLPGCLALLLPGASTDAADAGWLRERFGERSRIAAELLRGPDDRALLARLEGLSRHSGLPLVAAGDVHMHVRGRRALQDTLTAIRLKTTVAAAGHALHPSGERHLRRREVLAQIYPPRLLAATLELAERCDFSLDSLRYEYPEELVPPGQTPASWLRSLTEQGLARRFGGSRPHPHPDLPPAGEAERPRHTETAARMEAAGCKPGHSPESAALLPGHAPQHPDPVPPHVRRLVEHELTLIAELAYEPYFLTVHDIVAFARSRGILCQGRGSAANSAVCYALGITEVDPSRMSMLFERFISKERNEPPDIDVDFEHQRREEVMQYVFAKYGRDRAALAATVISYRPKSALRDVGKALGMDLAQVDRLAKSLAWWDGRKVLPERLAEAGFDPANPVVARLIALVNALVSFPRHLSQHVGGFVIARGLLSRLVPVENAAMPDRTVIQWDKDDLDALGLLKVDCLSLGMLSAIRRALEMVSQWQGRPFGMQDVPPEDPAVYAMIRRADTVGVFQIESRAQMAMLPRLRPACFYDLVIEVAIVRPGPIQGGMVHPYLRRRQGLEPVTYPSEAVREVLERTLGVPIFQEQVMRLAVVAAGFSPGEADRLRRSMAAWRRKGGLEHFEQRLMQGMSERGYAEGFARQIFQQIQGFGEYGFPESHSASFALLVYVSAWLKRHHPAAFCAALLNSQPMGFYAPAQLVQDARRHGVQVLPPDVLHSQWECTLAEARPPRQAALRLGLNQIKGLSQAAAERIVAARATAFDGIDDLARRAGLDRGTLEKLAAAGALAALSGHRREARWQVAGVEPPLPLLADAPIRDAPSGLAPPTEGDDLVADYASLGLTLGRHPLALLRPRLARSRYHTAAEIRALEHGRPARAAGIVIGRQRPDTASGVIFVTLEDETGHVNVVVWNRVAERQRRALLGSSLMAVHGTVEREGEVVHLVAGRITDESALLGRLATQSRDFH